LDLEIIPLGGKEENFIHWQRLIIQNQVSGFSAGIIFIYFFGLKVGFIFKAGNKAS